ncbi:Glycosyltransferase, catalytic subunit of cellulose synthase and poly-beta-1,6-N-acetylglucosamine synthase [Microlunatus sagamiharensis]|uniref:Glycosyltransferase, catalytic subunit of cellulose synthase and poly-beta-1,6-N-acetylglucosamine synthase n=1 Tax=Microlunatus sagamiharensis TaxID=546874 RepID=A0A1H2LRE3_9ACTN|nr:glycosyltransferase family 2 protein [Microlunatus sagamiharensis]SDU83412.1 Glycosyltransferase, catalytic subunit of cellulose synthase and poly-beta-1,6-N-acetylglucosamine synthase [Microlunatus sagamiharensis]
MLLCSLFLPVSPASAAPTPEPAPSASQLFPAGPAPSETSAPNRGPATEPAAVPGLLDDVSGGQVAGFLALSVVSLALAGVAFTTLAWMLHAWRSPSHLEATGFVRSGREPSLSFSLLVPARHEEEVLGDTLDKLAQLDHPDYEVIAIIGHDDPGTEAVARAAAARHPEIVRVVMDHSVPKNKPKGMNTALPECRGDVVGVFDAEDEVHPELLRLVDARFHDTGADVVQGGVQLMNIESSWWSLRNCLEYYFWFRSRLHFHAGARFIPLGGNTVFARAEVLREVDGWDPECLAEDCELGVRLSTRGKKVVVAYDPDVVTREETPPTLTSLYKQRTRWNQGFLQVLRKGEWRQLPTWRQRLMARYLLSMPFLQAFTGAMIPVSLLLILFAKVPTGIALLTFLPIVPTLITLVVETAGLGDFRRVYGVKVRPRDYVRLLLGTFPYQVFLAAAAVRSVVREVRGINAWEKTEHTGAHRPAVQSPSAPGTAQPVLTGAGAGGSR